MTSSIIDRRTNIESPVRARALTRDTSRVWTVASIAAGSVLILLSFAALIDARAHRGRIQRNVAVAGANLGGMNRVELATFLDTLDGRYRTMAVGIAAPEGGFSVTGADLGVTVQRQKLTNHLLAVGHDGGATKRIGSYLGSFFGTTRIEVPISVDATRIDATLAANDTDRRVEPVDPELIVQDDGFAIRPGRPGSGISGDVIVASLPLLVQQGPVGPVIAVDRVALPQRYSSDDLRVLVAEAERLTSNALEIRVGEKSALLQPKQLRKLVQPSIVEGRVRLTLDEEKALKAVVKALGKIGESPRDARLQVNNDGTVTAVPAQVGQVCCDADSVDVLNAALASGAATPVELRLKTIQPKVTTERITTLGVKELIGTFTTKHKPGEVRVKNIHHIADLTKGVVIGPGETFSVNAFVGQRTEANGFYKAHVIEDGVYTENFGGGISQYATTMFNAAFFAGLDLVEYQSHSLYISRYPYGREATLSFPAPDLKIRNNTPYGVLLWPTYTDRSLTISLYSTKYVTGEVGEQTIEKRNLCKRVYTTRIRTYVDGRTKTDRVSANYRPAEGVDCKGNPTAGATTLPPKTTTARSTKPADSSGSSGDNSTSDTKKPTSRAAVGAGDDADPPVTKPPKTEPKPPKTEPKPPKTEPKPADPTPPPDDGGGVAPAKPPVTGLG